jgi:RNA-binding protein
MPTPKELKNQARTLKHVMAIGKNGITEGNVKLLQRELEQKGLVKVKLLRGFLGEGEAKLDRKEAGARLAKLGQGQLVQVVGNVVVLYRPMQRA